MFLQLLPTIYTSVAPVTQLYFCSIVSFLSGVEASHLASCNQISTPSCSPKLTWINENLHEHFYTLQDCMR